MQILFTLLSFTAAFAAPTVVETHTGYHPGTVLILTSQHALEFVLDDNHAVRYPVATPKDGKGWTGTARIDGKEDRTVPLMLPQLSRTVDVRHRLITHV